ncbi:UPF0182 family protein [Microbacterium sp. NC79]|uniref:UPF0182 family membrane protein n=1 Tax=Microbacterium sp. NC79 TaxID=2851009 RepID=UPI001C2C9B4C|nr:UPF0182 family protein [Microbacterium sp. NC79]
MTTTSAPNPTAPSPARRVLVISLIVIAALVAGFFLFSNLFADYLWFDQLGFASVLTTQWIARAIMFVVGFIAMAVPVAVAINLSYRLRPVYARLSSQLDRYQEVIEPLRRLAMWGIPIFFGLFAGLSAATTWETVWLFFSSVDAGAVDPQFGMDLSFYMFALPFWRGLVAFASAVVIVCLLVTAFVSYLYGSVRVGNGELRISKAARIQLAIIAGLYLALQAVSLWLDRYATLIESRAGDRITGPGFTGANAVIPGLTILSVVAAVVAVLFIVTAIVGRWRYPLIGTALLLVTSLVLGMGYPWFVDTVQVKPNQLALEEEYYQHNIDMTQKAYGIDDLEVTDFKAETEASAGQLRADVETTASIRIMDPAIISPTVKQIEQYRGYYQFAETMDVDRYDIDGESQDVVVSVRELNTGALGQTDWQNTSIVYTHGYGIVAAAGNKRTADGNPVFLERGIPAQGFLSDEKFEPRVYFGEQSPLYSIVGAPKGTEPVEIDYPRGGKEGETETKTTFTGDGGPKIGNFFTKLIYAMKFQSEQILFSDYVNEDSQILYNRDPAQRVAAVAPYLTVDSDPYPSVVDGRIVWIVDAYTTSASYPYSSHVSLSRAIQDSSSDQQRFAIDNINYIRNSVKATVDAYDGSVTLYAWDDEDPVLKTWQNVYPGTIKPMSEMSGELMSHVRYPTDLFKVQRSMLGVYHVESAASFYRGDNVWKTPNDPQKDQVLQSPYYLTMKMPGQDEASYSMFTTFIPSASSQNSRSVMMGYLAVDSDAGFEAGKPADGYGKLRLLEINSDTTVPGPGQVQNSFDSNQAISSALNLLKQGNSQVLSGNLLTLPVGGGLLYVQPVYVQSSGSTKLPVLRKVLVAFGDEVAFEDTLAAALDDLFGGESGAETGDGDVTPIDPTTPPTDPGTDPDDQTGSTPDPSATPDPGATDEPAADKDALLKAASDALAAKQAALEAGDMVAYAEADKKLTEAIEKLLALEAQ